MGGGDLSSRGFGGKKKDFVFWEPLEENASLPLDVDWG